MPLHRRSAWVLAAALWAGAASVAPAETPAQGFPRLILNNDMTNWPIFAPGKDAATRADAAAVIAGFKASLAFGLIPGVDAQSLSVLYSTFPFWRSTLYSLRDHDAFLRRLAFYRASASQPGFPGLHASPMRQVLDGGTDLVRVFEAAPLDPPDGRPQQKILNVRVNDAHYTQFYDLFERETREEIVREAEENRSPICDSKRPAAVDEAETWAQTAFTGFFAGFRSGRLAPDLDDRCVAGTCLSAQSVKDECGAGACVMTLTGSRCPTVVLNFGAPSVRRFKLMQLEDLVGLHKPDTIELDFDRFPAYFPAAVPEAERRKTMLGWLREVHARLAALRPGLRIGLRVPNRIAHRRIVGIGLPDIEREGLADYAILAMPYFADQQPEADTDPRRGRLRLYAEMTHMSGSVPADKAVLERFGLDGGLARYWEVPVTSRQLVTAANQAHHMGLAGNALFNMQYYLRLGSPVPALDVPRSAIACMADPRCAAASDQEYVLATAHYHLPATANMLPIKLGGLSGRGFSLRLSPPAGGWGSGGLVSVSVAPQGAADPGSLEAALRRAQSSLRLRVNGVPLALTDAAWPQDTRDGPATRAHVGRLWFLQAPFRLVFGLDASRLVDGENRVELAWDGGPDLAALRIVDLRVFAPASGGDGGTVRAR